jgi:hypothetical protein
LTPFTEVKQQPNKDGSGKGQMAAWKVQYFSTPLPQIPNWNHRTNTRKPQAAKIGKGYEARGGDYENEPGSKNKPEKGAPQKKSEAAKKAETSASKSASNNNNSKPKPEADDGDDEEKGDEKPRANEGRKARGRPKGEGSAGAKARESREPRLGERSSTRQKGDKAEEPAAGGKKRKSAGGEESAAKKKKWGVIGWLMSDARWWRWGGFTQRKGTLGSHRASYQYFVSAIGQLSLGAVSVCRGRCWVHGCQSSVRVL